MNDYLMAIPVLEGHEQLLAIEVSAYPHLTSKEDRDKSYKSILKKTQFEPIEELDSIDLAKALGFGV